MEEVIKDGWQIIPADYKNTAYSSTGYYSSQPESYFKEQFHQRKLQIKERKSKFLLRTVIQFR